MTPMLVRGIGFFNVEKWFVGNIQGARGRKTEGLKRINARSRGI